MTKEKIFIGCPTYDGRIDAYTARALFQNATKRFDAYVSIGQFSLLNLNCNRLWCEALNLRKELGLKWFAMLHADVIPEPDWLDKLVYHAEKHDAVMMSVVVPIKDSSETVSTAIGNPINGWALNKLTLDDLQNLPVTFSIKDTQFPGLKLLVNTGCMVVRVDQDWSDRVLFRSEERIVRLNGRYEAQADPEDWNFSRQVGQYGKVMATQAVKVEHVGMHHWKNFK